MIVVVGLGNIGREYENTVHNMGFKVVDKLSRQLGFTFSKEKYKSQVAEGRIKNENIIIMKPMTYMNNSGEAVALVKKKFNDARILVVVDDIDLPRGTVRYRERGSAGTHNGLRSIVSYIGQEFERVKVGVGRNENIDLADYVLAKLNKDELLQFEKPIDDAVKIILEHIN
ncbi:MAG: aminoacyl-tRNA hydrolase [Clostridiales bacterium]|nr:aminoacyl-tRNA hydrolase [Clostridiales bacterium]